MAGLDNGQIFLYQTGIENKFSTYEILFQGKPHNNRVMGIDIEPKKNVVYSCSSDKKFVIGVQWHPENLSNKDKTENNIFKKFIEACYK